MTATYTPEVAAARRTLNGASFVGPHSAVARDAVQLLLADHARLAEENEKLGPSIHSLYWQAMQERDTLRAENARLAEENAKLRTIIDRQARKIAKIGERLHEHRVKLAKVQNEAAEHYSGRARLLRENVELRRVAKAARAYYERGTETTYVRLGEALAGLEVQNG